MTARWVVDEVQPNRDVSITWQPISLLVKNEPSEDSEYYPPVLFSHKLLRVLDAIRRADGNDGVERSYWHFGSLIHHDRINDFDVAVELVSAGFDQNYADAFDDESFDAEIDTRMHEGLDLVGTDVGTPIIALDDGAGDRVALFGPVITKVPDTAASLKLWDAFIDCATTPGFWELKRTRTERPDFGERPS